MYTPEKLKELFPADYDLSKEYLIETHQGAVARLSSGLFRKVGVVDDLSENPDGTMILLEKLSEKPSPTVKKSPRTSKSYKAKESYNA